MRHWRYRILALLTLLTVFYAGCGAANEYDRGLGEAVNPYRFNLLGWEIESLSREFSHWLAGSNGISATESVIVVEYFNHVAQENSLRGQLERDGNTQEQKELLSTQLTEVTLLRQVMERKAQLVLEAQIRQTASFLGIFNPLDSFWNWQAGFPPVKLALQPPPKLLVVSSRGVIERMNSITLEQDLRLEAIQLLESQVDALGVSSLVVDLGGIATYPSFVSNKYGLQFAIYTAIEEWLHQYLFFRPLGIRFALDEMGLSQAYEIIIMNETLAGMVSREMGDRLIADFYSACFPAANDSEEQHETGEHPFVTAMRRTRQEVDRLLELGEIEQADRYMQESRDQLEAQGYYIRKLNQAYFAFYGSYSDSPAFPNPIYNDLLGLRSASETLSEFLQIASSFTSREELAEFANR